MRLVPRPRRSRSATRRVPRPVRLRDVRRASRGADGPRPHRRPDPRDTGRPGPRLSGRDGPDGRAAAHARVRPGRAEAGRAGATRRRRGCGGQAHGDRPRDPGSSAGASRACGARSGICRRGSGRPPVAGRAARRRGGWVGTRPQRQAGLSRYRPRWRTTSSSTSSSRPAHVSWRRPGLSTRPWRRPRHCGLGDGWRRSSQCSPARARRRRRQSKRSLRTSTTHASGQGCCSPCPRRRLTRPPGAGSWCPSAARRFATPRRGPSWRPCSLHGAPGPTGMCWCAKPSHASGTSWTPTHVPG